MAGRISRVWMLCVLGLGCLALSGFGSSTDYGDVVLTGGFMAGHFSEVWDLTKGDMYIIFTVNLTGLVDDFGGNAHAWSELGVRTIGYGDFNPTWQAEGAGVWLATDYDWTANTFDPDPPGSPTLDLDDKLILQKAGGHGEADYNLPGVPPNPGANHRIWFDRDGVDQWQAQSPLAVDGGTYNTQGIYYIVIRLHATSSTTGEAYMTVNGLDQGFEVDGNWNTMELTPAGMTFTGDMTQMQVFYGLYGYGATHVVQFGDIGVVLTDVVWVDDDWAGSAVGDRVDGHYFGYDAFATVQDGVDHVGRSTVNVGLGVFVEQVEIDKNLTLQGSSWETIIQAPNTLTEYFETPKAGGGTNRNYPIIYVHDADDVTIRDLAVDGAGKGNANYRFIGIGFHNAGGTVDTVEVFGIRDTPFSGSQHGVAIYAYNEDGTPRTLTISNSFLHDFQKNGMALVGSGLTVRVEGNTVVGVGPSGTIAQNGIQVTYGAGGIISGNVVRDIWWTGPTWTASGILAGDTSADLEIVGNEVTNSQTGIYAYDTTGQLLIAYNRIENGNWNLILYNTPGAVVQFNAITGSGDGSWTDSSPNATLNWWGAAGGPSVDEDEDGTFEYAGGGEILYGNFIYSPWLGSDPDGDPTKPGVQVTGPMLIIVAPVGPEPTGGYLNTAIAGANELPFADTIEVRHGEYDASEPITGPVTILSEPGSASNTFLTGDMTLGAAGILIGRMGQGFTIHGNLTVPSGVDASTIRINWNNILGTVTNAGLGTLDATYNWWGGAHPATRTVGSVNYYPYLPAAVDEVLAFMARHGLDADAAIFLMARGGLTGEGMLILDLMNRFGLSEADIEALLGEYGFFRLSHALDFSMDYDDFVRLLLGYGAVPAGGAGMFVDLGVAGGAGSFQGRIVDAIYEVGQPIFVSFELLDFQGNPVTGIGAWVTLVQLHEDGRKTIWYWNAARYNPATGLHELSIPTVGLPQGYYSLLIGFRDGTKEETLIQIVAE